MSFTSIFYFKIKFMYISCQTLLRVSVSIFLPLLCAESAVAQTVKGSVFGSRGGDDREALSYATVFWMGGTRSAQTDMNGSFSITRQSGDSRFLIASFIGYKADTLEVLDFKKEVIFTLKAQNELDAAVVTGRREANYLSKIAAIRTEVISAAGLCKMACCNLAESFENSASVSVGYTDAVTGARQIRLLGLSGIYTQMSDGHC